MEVIINLPAQININSVHNAPQFLNVVNAYLESLYESSLLLVEADYGGGLGLQGGESGFAVCHGQFGACTLTHLITVAPHCQGHSHP